MNRDQYLEEPFIAAVCAFFIKNAGNRPNADDLKDQLRISAGQIRDWWKRHGIDHVSHFVKEANNRRSDLRSNSTWLFFRPTENGLARYHQQMMAKLQPKDRLAIDASMSPLDLACKLSNRFGFTPEDTMRIVQEICPAGGIIGEARNNNDHPVIFFLQPFDRELSTLYRDRPHQKWGMATIDQIAALAKANCEAGDDVTLKRLLGAQRS